MKKTTVLLVIALVLALFSGTAAAGSQNPKAPFSPQFVPATATLPDYSTNEVLVKYAPKAASKVKSLSSSAETVAPQTKVIRLKPGESVEKSIKELKSTPGVEYAEPNYRRKIDYQPSDPDYPNQWAYENTGQTVNGVTGTAGDDIGARSAWDIQKGTGNSVTVAVVDSGIDLNHPEFTSPVNKLVTGYNYGGISQMNNPQGYFYFGYHQYSRDLAQAIKGTGGILTDVTVLLSSVGTPTQPIVVSVRSNINGPDLGSFTITPDLVPQGSMWEVKGTLSSSVNLVNGVSYYIVFNTANSDSSNYYQVWSNNNCYQEGEAWFLDANDNKWKIYPTHPTVDLWFRTNANPTPHDDCGHGTHVAGIISAEENSQGGVGVAPGSQVKIMPIKVTDCNGYCYDSDIINAFHYAADNGAKIISISISGAGYSQAMQDACDYAYSKGVSIFAAAGNDNTNSLEYPAAYNHVMSVGATDSNDAKASFSNYGSTLDVFAPGTNIWSSMPTYPARMNLLGYTQNYSFMSGTSMATPMASGEAALILSNADLGKLANKGLEYVMETSAKDLFGGTGWDDTFGWGRINANSALTEDITPPSILALSKDHGADNASITIYGDRFLDEQIHLDTRGQVLFDGVPATVTLWSNNAIDVTLPGSSSGLGPKTLEVDSIFGSATTTYTVDNMVPKITGLNPDHGTDNIDVVISGTNFGDTQGTSQIIFDGKAATVSDWSDESITFHVPTSTNGSKAIVVTTAYGSDSKTYTVENPPVVTGLSSDWGPSGVLLDITGKDFGDTQGTSVVLFDGQPIQVNSWSSRTINVTVPDTATDGPKNIQVQTQFGTSNTETYTVEYNPMPTVTSLSPTSKVVGGSNFTLTVNGTNFVAGSKVRWDGSDRTTTYVSDNKLTASIPASDIVAVGTANVTVFSPAPGGGESNSQTFTINPIPVPTTISLSPTNKVAGDSGFTLTVNGTNFVTGSKVRWNGSNRATAYVSDKKLTAVINAADIATDGTFNVTVFNPTPGGGTSNAQTFTVKKSQGAAKWYLAEGATYRGYDEWLLLQNPNSNPSQVNIKYITPNGVEKTQPVTIPANSRVSIYVNDQIPNKDVSIEVDVTNSVGIIAERAMYFNGNDGKWGSHDSIGVDSTSPTWYLAEGCTRPGYDEWVLVFNPNNKAANIQVSFQTPNGNSTPIKKTLNPYQRYSVHVNDYLKNADVSTMVTCTTSGLGVVAERSMYITAPGKCDATNSTGVTSTNVRWTLAEGATWQGMEEWVLIQNPTGGDIAVQVNFFAPDYTQGPVITVAAHGRYSLRVNDYIHNKDVSVDVVAAKTQSHNGNEQFVVERAMYLGTADGKRGSTASAGFPVMNMTNHTYRSFNTWYLPEGCTLNGFDEWVLIANPTHVDTQVFLTFLTPDGKKINGPTLDVPASSRKTVHVNDYVTDSVSTVVTSNMTDTSNGNIVVERAMYMNGLAGKWGATDSLGYGVNK